MSQRCIIFIDGSNFYFKLKDLQLHSVLSFNYASFGKFLARSNSIVSFQYYIGRVRQDGSKHADEMLANQQKLFANLKQHRVKYTLGYLLKNNGKYHEKGVDVQIAVDILVATYENLCDRIIIVSSDTDLEPAIKKAREKGKIVEYVGFSHKPSVAMVSFCSESTLLKKEDLLPLINSHRQKNPEEVVHKKF